MDTVEQHFEFHRLARSAPKYRWWKPLLTALLGIVFYVVFTIVVMVPAVILAALSPAGAEPYLEVFTELDLSNPVVFAIAMVSLILMIPALALATLIMGPRPLGLLSSVAGRIRWRWLLVCSGAALAVFGVSIGISLLLELLFPPDQAAPPIQQDTSTLILLLALSLLAVPFQAAAEEYVFRGYLMQAIGGWLRHPAFAILLPVPLFVLGHGYEPLGQADVAVFALFAGWITWRTGGLEAAIAVHAVNNVTIFVLGAVGLVDVNATGSSVGGLVVSVLTTAVTAVVLVRLADRRGIRRTRTVTPRPAAPYGFMPGPPLPRMDEQYAYPQQYQRVSQGPSNPWAQGTYPSPSAPGPRCEDAKHGPHILGAAHASELPVPPPPAPEPAPGTPAPATGVTPPAQGGAPSATPAGRSTNDPVPHPADPVRRHPAAHPPGSGHPAGPAFPPGSVHPAGPGFPPGTAFPPGVPYPDGPGFPGPVAVPDDARRRNDDGTADR